MLPEDLGRNCARLLLEEIYRVRLHPLLVWERSHREAVFCLSFYSVAAFSSKGLSQEVNLFLSIHGLAKLVSEQRPSPSGLGHMAGKF